MSKSAQEHIAHINELIDGDITLRDYFAAQILNGHIAGPVDDDGALLDIANWAYEFADAMLEAREQGK
jgi:hypothetical protein